MLYSLWVNHRGSIFRYVFNLIFFYFLSKKYLDVLIYIPVCYIFSKSQLEKIFYCFIVIEIRTGVYLRIHRKRKNWFLLANLRYLRDT